MVIDGLRVSRSIDDYMEILMLILTRSVVGRLGENTYLFYKFMAMEPYFNVLMAHAEAVEDRPGRICNGLQAFPAVHMLWVCILQDHGRPVPTPKHCR
jgi:hypothetical protein